MSNDRMIAEAVTRKLAEVVCLRDPALADHLYRTAEVACALGAQMGADLDTLDLLYTAGLLHDIGKLAISEAILWKPSGLTRSEWEVVRVHPEAGHRLIADVMQRDVASAVLNHHERLDGDGYPRGLDASTLPMVVRIIQVADAFDAMTSRRPYRPAMGTRLAVAEVTRCAGSQFDPEVAAALTDLFEGHGEELVIAGRRHAPASLARTAVARPGGVPCLVRLRDLPA
jgi:HD-GYP domain-containing protein (c-di-GMP phosphodiesterase class II)